MGLKFDDRGKFVALPMLPKEKLTQLYIQENKTPFQIGQESKVSANTVRRWLEHYGISVKRPYTSYVKADLSTVESAYLAGYLDGDGSINFGLIRNKRSKRGLNPHFEVSLLSKDRQFVETLKNLVGGRTITSSIYHDGRAKKEGYKLHFCNQASALAILEQLEPFLILKKQQAKLMILFLRERLKSRQEKGNCALISESCWEIIRGIRRLNDGCKGNKRKKIQI